MSPEEPRTHHLLPASEWTFCPTCPLTQVRGLLLRTGVSLGRHVTAQRQSHWLNRSFKTTDIWLQFPGYSAAFSKSMPICKYRDVYLAPTCVCRLSRNWQVSRWVREALSTRARTECFNLLKKKKETSATVLTIYTHITPVKSTGTGCKHCSICQKRDLREAVVVMGTSMASPKGFACTFTFLTF